MILNIGKGIYMVEKIFDNICKAVAEEFGLPVYTERVVQGVAAPCFIIRLESSVTELFFGKRYLMKNRFKIMYLDDSACEHINCASIVERLCAVLEYTDYGEGRVSASNLKCEIEENHLDLYADYNLFVYKHDEDEEAAAMMESLKITN
jgi:hypothetical protein